MLNTLIKNIRILSDKRYYNADSLLTPVRYRDRTIILLNGNRFNTAYNSVGQPCRGTDLINIREGIGDIPPHYISDLINPLDMLKPDIGQGNIHSISCCVNKNNTFYSYISDEVSFNEDGNVYQGKTGDGYSHISLCISKTPYIKENNIKDFKEPFLEHWQSLDYVKTQPSGLNRYNNSPIYNNNGELEFQYPNGVQGLTSPDVITHGGIHYMFYTRFVDLRKMNYNPEFRDSRGYPPNISKNNNEFLELSGSNICIAISRDLINWDRYYEGPRENKFIDEYELKGELDTCVMPVSSFFGKICYNEYLKKFLYISATNKKGKIILLSSPDLFRWTLEHEFPFENAYYPNLFNKEGNSDKVVGKEFIVTYCLKVIDQPNYIRMNWVLADGEFI